MVGMMRAAGAGGSLGLRRMGGEFFGLWLRDFWALVRGLAQKDGEAVWFVSFGARVGGSVV